VFLAVLNCSERIVTDETMERPVIQMLVVIMSIVERIETLMASKTLDFVAIGKEMVLEMLF